MLGKGYPSTNDAQDRRDCDAQCWGKVEFRVGIEVRDAVLS